MSIDLVEAVLTWIVGGLLAVSATLTLVRITIGPSVLDRVVATDVLVSIVICALGAYAALSDAWTTLPLLISLSLVGFLGSVAVARFVARDRDTPVPDPMPDRLAEEDLSARPLPADPGPHTRPSRSEGEGSR
ncbi:monovalent cation/H+ antiporter complex subunit F [Ornithinimicrobium sp. LYQ92]|uniref:monovalent cation/H+ antiporter complex subunit F n=1 Tax=Serinicoccus sp. LYQ92 TaxID=3378798 RepID=UPI003851DBC3